MGANSITSLSEAYEAAEAGNFQVSERLQSLFASPYAEHPEDMVDTDHDFIDWSKGKFAEHPVGTNWFSALINLFPQIIRTMWF